MPDAVLIAAGSPLDTLNQQFGICIFFALIATALALIGYGFFATVDTHVRSRFATIGAALLCAMIAVFIQTKIDGERGFIADQESRFDAKVKEIARRKGKEEALKLQYMYMPAGNSLNYLTLNNPSLAADYVWLTSLQFVSNSFRRGNKFEMLSRFHTTMSDLDPHWVDAEVNGGKVLSALIEEREKSELCFQNDIAKNWDNPKEVWKLRYEAGLLFINPPNDPRRMAEYSRKSSMYFDQAMQEKYFPRNMVPQTKDRIARLRLESGSAFYREAERMMAQNAIAADTPESLKKISQRDWLKAHSMAQAAALTDEAAAYKKKNGTFPKDLSQILMGFDKPEAFATDAYGFPFDYNSETGIVTSHGAKALHAIQSGHVINELLLLFRSEHGGRFPRDLIELRTFLRQYKSIPLYPPSVMVLEAIGLDFDATTGPLGPWKYDADKGEIVFPPECNGRALYAHVDDYEWKPTGIVKKSKAP